MKTETRDLAAAIETRTARAGISLRADDPSIATGQLHGYAARFASPSAPMADLTTGRPFVEVIAPGAFARSLRDNPDVRALWNHDTSIVLGRTTSGTLRLEEDDDGLSFEIDLPDTRAGQDIRALVARGDIDGVSFGFMIVEDEWEERKGEPAVRTLLDVDLFEVSPCTFPAYESSRVSVRSRHTRHKTPPGTPRLDHSIRALWLSAIDD